MATSLGLLGERTRSMPQGYLARHGAMRFLGEFAAEGDAVLARGQRVLLRTERGVEQGELLCESSPRAVSLIVEPTKGQVVRPMDEADEAEAERIRHVEVGEFDTCVALIAQRKLQME